MTWWSNLTNLNGRRRMPSVSSHSLSGCEEGVFSPVSQADLLSGCHESPFYVSSLSCSCCSFFILIQMIMLVFGTFWFVLMLSEVSDNHYPIASMSISLGSTVNPLALNYLSKKKLNGIWEVLKNIISTLKICEIFCVAEESRREKVGLLSSCFLYLLLGKGWSTFLLKQTNKQKKVVSV